MMMKKKNIIIPAVIGGVILIAALGFVLSRYIRERNVFDQMYYTRVHKYFNWWNPGQFRGKFANMKQLWGIGRDEEESFTNAGIFYEEYKSKYLKPDTSLNIYFWRNPRRIYIKYRVKCDPEDPESEISVYQYIYSVDDKTLTYSEKNVTDPQDGNRNFLYDILLKDWFEANPDPNFSLQDPGQFEFREISWEESEREFSWNERKRK